MHSSANSWFRQWSTSAPASLPSAEPLRWPLNWRLCGFTARMDGFASVGERITDRPARSKSLYRLCYPSLGNDTSERVWKQTDVAWEKCYPGMYLGERKKATKILNQDNWCPDRNSKLAPAEYKCKASAVRLLAMYKLLTWSACELYGTRTNDSKVVPVQATKVHTRRRGTAPLILSIKARRTWVVGLNPVALYPGKEPWSGHCKRDILPLSGNKPCILGHPACSLVIVPIMNTLFRFIQFYL